MPTQEETQAALAVGAASGRRIEGEAAGRVVA